MSLLAGFFSLALLKQLQNISRIPDIGGTAVVYSGLDKISVSGGDIPGTIPSSIRIRHSLYPCFSIIGQLGYQEVAEYYGTAIIPARVRKPQGKSSTEAFALNPFA